MVVRSPVITGVGVVTAVGCGVTEVWQAVAEGNSGLKSLTLFESPRNGQSLVAEIRRDLTSLGAPLRGSRSDRLGWLAAREALETSRINLQRCGERAGIVLGSSVGGSFDSERFLTTLIKKKMMRARPARFHECVSVVDIIANDFGLFGPSMAVATACSSGALAIATAAELIQAGDADVMLAGGADSLSRMTWGGFHALLLVDAAGCRPFDSHRAGMSLGEGAAVLVIEAEETAQQRGATILARLTGWGATCDAYHVTAPHPEGEGAIMAMQAALKRAGLEPTAIDYVNAHGTGTRDNDLAETKALKKLFGERVPPFSSTKRIFGHALAASGAIEAVVCVEALRRKQLPPNPGFTSADSTIGLEPITECRPAELTHVMSNSFGFGGNNCVLIFSRAGAEAATRVPPFAQIAVAGLGVIGPGAIRIREIEPPLPTGRVSVHECSGPDEARLSASQRRRLSRLAQMAVVSARDSHRPNGTQRLAIAIGTGMGFLGAAGTFLENYISKEEREPMPSQFPASVHNAAASQVAMDLRATGMNSAPTAGEISFECALFLAMAQLRNGEADCALAGAADELNKYILGIGQRWGMWTERTRPGEGAMVAKLIRSEMSSTALGRVTALRLGRYRRPFDAEREADWIESAMDLSQIDILMSGAGGWPMLDPMYQAVASALNARAGRKLEHETYKTLCGEFHAASAFGFAVALDRVSKGSRGVLLYTLSLRGGKAICCLQP